MECVKCGLVVEEELRVPFRQCSHRVHADCLLSDPEEQRSYKKCGLCLGHYAPLEKKVVSSAPASFTGEPRLLGNRDWVLSPGARNTGSVMKKVASYIPGLSSKVAENVSNSTNPFFLLQYRKPVGAIMRENGLGLDHFLQVGVTMRDFLQHGYTWNDLKEYEDIAQRGPHRCLQAISTGLKTTANDFRDYPDALPLEEVKAHTKFRNGDVCRLFGLTFPEGGTKPGDPLEGGYLECAGDRNWNAMDCVNMGLSFSDLKDFGLAYVHQYLQMMTGLSEADADAADKALDATEEQIGSLIDLEAEEEERQRIEAERLQQEYQARQRETERRMEAMAQRRVAPVEEEYEEEEEEDTRVYHASPPPPAQLHFNPPPPRAVQVRIPTPLYAKRIKERNRRHGALIK